MPGDSPAPPRGWGQGLCSNSTYDQNTSVRFPSILEAPPSVPCSNGRQESREGGSWAGFPTAGRTRLFLGWRPLVRSILRGVSAVIRLHKPCSGINHLLGNPRSFWSPVVLGVPWVSGAFHPRKGVRLLWGDSGWNCPPHPSSSGLPQPLPWFLLVQVHV